MLAQHSSLGAVAGVFGGGGSGANVVGGENGLDARGLQDAQTLGIPVKQVKAGE